jgi:hypothetical protein
VRSSYRSLSTAITPPALILVNACALSAVSWPGRQLYSISGTFTGFMPLLLDGEQRLQPAEEGRSMSSGSLKLRQIEVTA